MRTLSVVALVGLAACASPPRSAPKVAPRSAVVTPSRPVDASPPPCPPPVLAQPPPSERELDTRTYDALVESRALRGFARAAALRDWLGKAEYTIDLTAARVTVAGRGSYPVQLVGTYASASESFLWAWANASVTACRPKERIVALHARAEKDHGPSPFLQRKIAEKWVPHGELVAVVADLEERPWLAVPFGAEGGTAIVLVDAPVPLVVDAPLAKRAIDEALANVVSSAPSDLVAAFLERSGFDVVRHGALRMEARRGAESLSVVFANKQALPRVDVPAR